MRMTTLIASLIGLMLLAGCVGGSGPNISDYATSCMFEVSPKGAVVWSDGDTEVKIEGGNAEEAAAMNDCITRKAAEAGVSLTEPAPGAGGAAVYEIERSTAVRTGTGVTETYTYGTPPASSPAAAPSAGESCRRRNVLSGGSGYGGCL